MKITIPETVLRNGEIITIKKENQVKKPIIVSDTIPKFVQDHDGVWVKKLSYMDAVLHYADTSDIEPEAMAKMLNQSTRDKIEVEAQNLNMLKRTAKLPI